MDDVDVAVVLDAALVDVAVDATAVNALLEIGDLEFLTNVGTL